MSIGCWQHVNISTRALYTNAVKYGIEQKLLLDVRPSVRQTFVTALAVMNGKKRDPLQSKLILCTSETRYNT